jgi:cytochrome bd-type quinol oxidase subunit 1
MKLLIRAVIANGILLLCILLANALPGLWSGEGGRDFVPQAFTAGLLILLSSTVLRYKSKWPVSHMIFSLFPTQVIILAGISSYSGYTGKELFNSFNLGWLLHIDLLLCIPWIAGAITGNLILRYRN